MRVSPRLLVLKDCDLDVHCLHTGPTPIVQREDVPAARLNKLNYFDLLELVEAVGDSDRQLLRSVAFVGLEVQVER